MPTFLFLIFFIYFQSLRTQTGNEVTCNIKGACNASNCGAYEGVTWQNGSQVGTCFIQDCSVLQFPTTNLSDAICGSCPPSQDAIYASTDKKNCITFSQYCESVTNFTDSLCQQCYPTKLYPSSDQTQCVASSQPCNVTSGWKDNDCSLCIPTRPHASPDGKTCTASAIPCNSTSGWNDENCSQCYPLKMHASLDGKSCVNSKIPCKSTRGWTDSDCAICYPDQKYASLDQTSCVSSSKSCTSPVNLTDSDCKLCNPVTPFTNFQQIYCVASSISCINRNPTLANQKWTDNDCQVCYAIGYRSKLDGSACINCQASLGLSNDDCLLCNGSGIGSNKYANSMGTCVSVNCQKSSGWIDSECSTCDSVKPKASSDGQTCLNTTYSDTLKIYALFFTYLFSF